MNESTTPEPSNQLPKAIERTRAARRGIPGLVLLIAIAAIGLAIYAAYASRKPKGIDIKIQFADGGGLQVGDQLRHRGVSVGEIRELQLSKDLDAVQVMATLRPEAILMATEGTRYWIVKPQASMKGVSGLETILGGQYIAVDPSRRKSEKLFEFEGLSEPPAVQLPGDALEIVLEAENAAGLQPATPITYRGLEVGRVQSVGLSPDSRWVRVQASIDANYESLVRSNSVFWLASGLKMNMGLSGFALETGSLSNLAFGGIEFATPEPPGTDVAIGQRFELHAKPEDEWKAWQTPIATGPGLRLDMETMPTMQLAALKWKTSFYGIKRSSETQGWVLTLNDGTLIGPSNLFKAPEDAIAGSVSFECLGKSWPIEKIALRSDAQAATYRIHLDEMPDAYESWPANKLGKIDWSALPEQGVLLCEGNQRYVPIEASNIQISKDGTILSKTQDLPKPLHGSTILNMADRNVIAVVIADEENAVFRIEALPK
jgi:hypothetical protein